MSQKSFFVLLGGLYILALGWSAIGVQDYLTWFMEIVPSLIGVVLLIVTYRRFQFSRAAYVIVLLHSLVLFVGGKYTYPANPLFAYLAQVFDWPRNNYDKLGHFVQGFFPAFLIRELVIRLKVFARPRWIMSYVLGIVALITVVYELLEWLAAVIMGGSADTFLGMQGYIWDTQTDMFLALLGGFIACVGFAKLHDVFLKKEQLRSQK
jgi:putative membrane protein